MADRRVKRSGKDDNGDITRLCGSWGNEAKSTVIQHIESGTHRYYTNEENQEATVEVIGVGSSKYLRTTPDSSSKNNLDNLPDC